MAPDGRRARHKRGPLTAAAVVAAAAVLAAAAAGCSSPVAKSATDAPVLSVVTGLWPLAEAASEIGGSKAAVANLVPAGADPFSFQPGPAGAGTLQSAGLVVLAGRGLQPALATASKSAPRVLRVADRIGAANAYVWLDPATMQRAVQVMADAMAAANPAAASLYQRNAGGLRSEIGSLDVDYSSTLSTCRNTNLVTPDAAFTTMAAHYGLTDLVIPAGTGSSDAAGYAARLKIDRAGAAFTQPWVDNSGVEMVATAAGVKTHTVDTLAGAPTSGTPAQNTYLNRMEQVLGTLSGPLGCNSTEQ